MPLIALAGALALLVLLLALLVPLSLIGRYRMGTARRRARGWAAAVNLIGLAGSAGLLVASAAVASAWAPDALAYTLAGLGAGLLLGVAGLALTRWERTPAGLYYTPNRLLVLGISLVVALRLAYGLWRGLSAWRAGVEDGSWVAAAGLAGSMSAGALVLGYYLAYWFGIRQRLRRA